MAGQNNDGAVACKQYMNLSLLHTLKVIDFEKLIKNTLHIPPIYWVSLQFLALYFF
jgi:hypothetical protein